MNNTAATFRFDWHKEPGDTFLKWMIVNLVTGIRENSEYYHLVKEATKNFTDIELDIRLSGIRVPTENFIEGIQANMEWGAEKSAKNMLEEIAEINIIKADIQNLSDMVKERLSLLAKKHGLDYEDF